LRGGTRGLGEGKVWGYPGCDIGAFETPVGPPVLRDGGIREHGVSEEGYLTRGSHVVLFLAASSSFPLSEEVRKGR